MADITRGRYVKSSTSLCADTNSPRSKRATVKTNYVGACIIFVQNFECSAMYNGRVWYLVGLLYRVIQEGRSLLWQVVVSVIVRKEFRIYTVCPTRYRTRHFFNNFTTNEDIATNFEADYRHISLQFSHTERNSVQISLQYLHWC